MNLQHIMQLAIKQEQQRQLQEIADSFRLVLASRLIARLVEPKNLADEMQLALEDVKIQFTKEGLDFKDEDDELMGLMKSNLLEMVSTTYWEIK